MNYNEKNMETIETCKSYLYEKINAKQYDRNINTLDQIEMIPTKCGDTALEITFQSKKYRLNSSYDPVHEAKRWIMQYDMKNIGIIVIMFGLGNGVFIRELLKHIREDVAILIYEPSQELFFYVIEHYDISDILSSGNVSITVEGINDNEIKNLLSNYIDWINLKSQIVTYHPQYDNIFSGSVKKFIKIVQDNMDRTVVNKNTDIAISGLTVTNTIRNIKYLPKYNLVTDLKGKFSKDTPAIIVAAGPSLDKNIEELKRAKGKAVIFAVDTAMKYLLAHNIEPDFIVTLDPKKALRHLRDERCKQIPIFSRIDSRPENIEQNQKRIILYNLEGYVKTILEQLEKDTGILNSGGSVATGAFSICETIGFQRIILVGQDLAYLGESTHAGGLKVDVSDAGSHTQMVEDIYGNPIKTRYDWYVYIRWFEDAVDMFEGEEVIDATEGGAKIKGTTILTLRDAIDQYCTNDIDCDRIISELETTLSTEEAICVRELMIQDIKDLTTMKEKAIEAIQLSDKLIEKYEKSITESTSSTLKNHRLSQLNHEMEEKNVYELIDWDISAATTDRLGNLYVYSDDEKQNKLDTYQKAKLIYGAMIESIDRIKPLLEDGIRYFN
ncbi:MAG: hypothetical protein K0S47_782 [Herbinix sp.]|jgi:hypothetical protein|nr:hypothetical protein [Herbinix sp.]